MRGRSRSRRRRRNRGREILVGFLRLLLALFLLICLTVGGVFGYRYWEGNKTSETPLETSREVAPETMGESH
ncbi:hypothetical protein [Lacrimispora celerecrescens]|nr:hypothetical protein [Lacrimispora celerecrescens]